jgi:hypothetical protein
MRFWKRRATETPPTALLPLGRPPTWFRTLASPEVLPRVGILAGLVVAALLIVQLPRTPLPVRKGEHTTHPIMARVNFDYVDHEVTASVRNLAALVRVPSIYDPDPRPVVTMKDGLMALAGQGGRHGPGPRSDTQRVETHPRDVRRP